MGGARASAKSKGAAHKGPTTHDPVRSPDARTDRRQRRDTPKHVGKNLHRTNLITFYMGAAGAPRAYLVAVDAGSPAMASISPIFRVAEEVQRGPRNPSGSCMIIREADAALSRGKVGSRWTWSLPDVHAAISVSRRTGDSSDPRPSGAARSAPITAHRPTHWSRFPKNKLDNISDGRLCGAGR